ncbi:MAG TPA: hypothetical protein VN843_04255, partial [Anaerolineales bacterium]|nr:hypothetical protein [Anaerolineales bacterium]
DERGREELLDGRGAWKNTVYMARSAKADAGVMVARSTSCAYIRKQGARSLAGISQYLVHPSPSLPAGRVFNG